MIDHDWLRIDRRVNDISTALKLDNDLLRDQESEFELAPMISRLSQYFEQKAAATGIMLVADMPEKFTKVVGLEERLAQVIMNLITNAISFCGAGDVIRIWVRQCGNRILIMVKDMGPGLSDGSLQKTFDRF